MSERTDELASWASVLGGVASILGLIQSQAWMTVVGLALVSLSTAAVFYARRGQRRLRSASIAVDGLNLDSLNIANLRRRMNRSLFLQRAYHLAKIEGRDLTVAWQSDGFCRGRGESSIEFSVDSENNIPFSELECFAFDLEQDPERHHKIRPMLVGADGLSKKLAVPLLRPLLPQQPFSVLLNCRLPDCMGSGVQYYTSSLSFEQRRVAQLAVHLVFVRRCPDWVRVYECDRRGRPKLRSDLQAFKNDGETCEYLDLNENVAGQSVRIYVYSFGPGNLHSNPDEAKRLLNV